MEYKKQYSLFHRCLRIGAVIILLNILVAVLATYQRWNYTKVTKLSQIREDAVRVVSLLEYSLAHIEEIMIYATEAIKRNPNDLEAIWAIISDFKNTDIRSFEILFNTLIWIDDKNRLLVASGRGIIENTNDQLVRDYISDLKTMIVPKKLHISHKPVIGHLTNSKIISAAIGISENNRYLGSLVAGIDLETIMNAMHSVALSPDSKMGLYFRNAEITEYNQESHKFFEKKLTDAKFFITKKAVNGYPLEVLVIQKKPELLRSLTLEESWLFIIFIIFNVCTVFILICFPFMKNIKQIKQLGEAAEALAKDQYVSVPSFGAKETDALGEQLKLMARKMHELEETKHALKKKGEDAEIANKAKSEFMARVSHELKNPLNAISICVQLMEKRMAGTDDSQHIKHIKCIKDQGKKLLNVINDILLVSRAEVGLPHSYKLEAFSVKETLEEAIKDFESEIIEKGIIVKIKCHDTRVKIMDTGIKRALWHIISNSVKFVDKDGTITITSNIKTSNSRSHIEIKIEDDGIGMKGNQINLACETFNQLDGGINRRFEGLGVGLPLARSMLKLQGGFLHIASEENQGTTVTIQIPIY